MWSQYERQLSNLKEVTLSMVPTVVERSDRLDLARCPRIISLVLKAFNCMSLLSVYLLLERSQRGWVQTANTRRKLSN